MRWPARRRTRRPSRWTCALATLTGRYHIGLLRAKLAKLRLQLLEPEKKGSSKPGEGFDVMKSGNARVVLIGFPSVGKSTLLSTITETESATAGYEYTTLTAIPYVSGGIAAIADRQGCAALPGRADPAA